MPHQLAIIGLVPSAFGGASAHVQRLLPFLDEAGIKYFVYDTGGDLEIPGKDAVQQAMNSPWGRLFEHHEVRAPDEKGWASLEVVLSAEGCVRPANPACSIGRPCTYLGFDLCACCVQCKRPRQRLLASEAA